MAAILSRQRIEAVEIFHKASALLCQRAPFLADYTGALLLAQPVSAVATALNVADELERMQAALDVCKQAAEICRPSPAGEA